MTLLTNVIMYNPSASSVGEGSKKNQQHYGHSLWDFCIPVVFSKRSIISSSGCTFIPTMVSRTACQGRVVPSYLLQMSSRQLACGIIPWSRKCFAWWWQYGTTQAVPYTMWENSAKRMSLPPLPATLSGKKLVSRLIECQNGRRNISCHVFHLKPAAIFGRTDEYIF